MSDIKTVLLDMYRSMAQITVKLLNGTRNDVISPLSIYRILSMLSEITAGNTRDQIDALIGKKKFPTGALSEFFDTDENKALCNIADSIWVNPSFEVREKKLLDMKEKFGCDTFVVPFGREETDGQIHDWVNEKTRDMLSEYTEMIQTSPFDVAVLLSTIYLKTAWADPFDKDDNLVEYFTDEDGKRTKCEFMSEQGIGTVYSGSCFKAIRKQMNEEFDMFLVLPNKGTDLWEVMGCKDVYVLISSPFPPNSRDCYVIARVPKFDVSAYNNLDDMMKSLGITDVFDYKAADFSPFIKGRQFYISEADQAARVKIDEEGFEGAAWTRMDMTWGCADPYAGMEMEVVKFYLDRPFAFFVVKRGIPVFAGTVTQPIETDKEYIGGKEIDVEAILKELKKARKGFDSFLSLSSSMDDDKEDEEP